MEIPEKVKGIEVYVPEGLGENQIDLNRGEIEESMNNSISNRPC